MGADRRPAALLAGMQVGPFTFEKLIRMVVTMDFERLQRARHPDPHNVA
jgi:hypothetical protein